MAHQSVRLDDWITNMQGIANRDLKLENLLLDRDGRDGTRPLLKICDFGYSKHEMNSSAKTGVGTPVYMAPEVILGEAKYDAKVGRSSHCCHDPFPKLNDVNRLDVAFCILYTWLLLHLRSLPHSAATPLAC